VYVSGQIPFVPGCMSALPCGFIGQCYLAFDHAMTVAAAMEVTSDDIISAHCYVTRDEDVKTALSLEVTRGRIPDHVSLRVITTEE